MKKIALLLCLLLSYGTEGFSQYADLGTGNLKNQIWWFDWSGFTIAENASRTFNTGDGLAVTIKFSNVQGPVFQPSVMNTWYGAVLHFLYDFSDGNIKPALYSPYTTQNSHFTITVTATRNGLPAPFKFVGADAEASAVSEITTITSNGSPWQCIDFFRNSAQTTNPFLGCNTNTAIITDTYGGGTGIGQNPVIATDALAGSLTLDCLFDRSGVDGQMGIAFGIFGAVDMGDLPAGYGNAQHRLLYTTSNPCNYLPPLPATTQSTNLSIGAVAGDADPVPSLDDNANGVDEDGITTFLPYDGSGTYSLTVPVNNTTGGSAYLAAWFDLNRNGILESSERIINTIPNNTSSTTLSWTGLPAILPPGTADGWAFRLRLSTDQNSLQLPTGIAPDGEVEDYLTRALQITTADFLATDTVCVGEPVTITNTSINATTYYWNFCVANVNSTPSANNIGNPGNQLGLPVFMDYVQVNGNYYAFVTNNMPGKLTRLDFGNSLLNTPSAVDLGNVGGVIPDAAEGIQLAFSQGNWYAIIVGGNPTTGGSRIVKIDFGPNLTNSNPTGTNWGNIGNMNYPGDLHLFNDNGNWYAFTVDQSSNVYRFTFGPNFQNPPTFVNFGNVGGSISWADGIYIINDNGLWHGFVCSRNNSSITRLDFGNSLLNTPTGTNLGNPNNTLNLPRDIYIMKFCNEIFGFVVNEGSNTLVKLNFTDLLSIPTAVSLGNVGNLAFPHSISKLFRVGPDLYSFITNVNNNTITRIQFSGCVNSSIPNFSGANPPAVSYSTPGIYNINLTIDEGLSTQASVCKQVVVLAKPDLDFSYQVTSCNPLTVQFSATGTSAQNPYWDFGDANTTTGTFNPVHSFTTQGNYVIRFGASNGRCTDTVTKSITLSIIPDDIIRTQDTTICFGTSKQLLTKPALGFCWSPSTYLDNPNSPNPVTFTPQNITYYYTAEVAGNNLIANGDFSQGNTGFTSAYGYANPNTTEGQYFVGTNPTAWNGGLSSCGDHTSGNGNMMLVNGAPTPDLSVWKQTITVTPNTNYAFSTWIQALIVTNPAQLQFSINGNTIGTLIYASTPPCTWTQFYTTWNSGNNTSAIISIVNKNTIAAGNDFALDDISFAPVLIKRDSVRITVDKPLVQASPDASICPGGSVQLNSNGAVSYSWSPSTGLNNATAANPLATPATTTQYVVTGTNANGCAANDTVVITVNPKPTIVKSPDPTICKNTSTQLSASGGTIYSWTPTSGLNDPNIANPIATVNTNTVYYVTVTDAVTTCSNIDSIRVNVHPDPVFSVMAPPPAICQNESVQLSASGGDIYSWQPGGSLSNPSIANPVATPATSTTYTVQVTETTCNNSTVLQTTVTVNPLPNIHASKSNDLDCSLGQSQLLATGGLSYTWSPSTGLDNPTVANPVASPVATTLYTVKGTDQSGCSAFDSVKVNVLVINESHYEMPNAFTPNGDGLNDCFGVKYWGVIQEFEFSVYNRWGQRLFYSKNPGACWDGTFRGVAQDIGVYVYMIKAKTLCGETFRKGLFTLIR
jgi:gliding motility-associated-like protein